MKSSFLNSNLTIILIWWRIHKWEGIKLNFFVVLFKTFINSYSLKIQYIFYLKEVCIWTTMIEPSDRTNQWYVTEEFRSSTGSIINSTGYSMKFRNSYMKNKVSLFLQLPWSIKRKISWLPVLKFLNTPSIFNNDMNYK